MGLLLRFSGGALARKAMTKEVLRVKMYGNVALVTGRGKNTGYFNEQPIAADEWITDVYHQKNGAWVCVLTHLTPVQGK